MCPKIRYDRHCVKFFGKVEVLTSSERALLCSPGLAKIPTEERGLWKRKKLLKPYLDHFAFWFFEFLEENLQHLKY